MTDDQDRSPTDTEEGDDPGWPLSFLLLVGAGALYLILRVVDLVRDVL
jgi:hypothetical protein